MTLSKTLEPQPTTVPSDTPDELSALSLRKSRGGYYTPTPVAKFLAEWGIQTNTKSVLEPSAGDGEIVAAAADRLNNGRITAIELVGEEAEKTKVRGGNCTDVITGDFFSWFNENRPTGKFDAVLGNPPFIRYQSFGEEHRIPAFSLMKEEGLHPSRLTNAWLPFVVASVLALRPGGRIALVLPGELLQVKYAAELRQYLARSFSHLTVVTFRSLVFSDIQQETVLLLGIRDDSHKGAEVSFVELDHPENLSISAVNKTSSIRDDLNHAQEKWTQYYLTQKELELIRSIEHESSITRLGDLAEVDVGIVTGRNEFFVLTQEEADRFGVKDYCIPLIGRSHQIPGLVLSNEDWQSLASNDSKCLLMQLGDVDREYLTNEAREYVASGELRGFHTGYKCRIRLPNWWKVPSVWAPDAFLLRQIYDGPRIISNRSGAVCTDTIHRVRTNGKVNGEYLAAASVNSLTFAFAELKGRSYGGGVLELEPSEAEDLPFPKVDIDLDTDWLDWLAKEGSTERVLDEVDRRVLEAVGIARSDIKTLREIWHKLFTRRLRRKRR